MSAALKRRRQSGDVFIPDDILRTCDILSCHDVFIQKAQQQHRTRRIAGGGGISCGCGLFKAASRTYPRQYESRACVLRRERMRRKGRGTTHTATLWQGRITDKSRRDKLFKSRRLRQRRDTGRQTVQKHLRPENQQRGVQGD